jgi:hypothetical protein
MFKTAFNLAVERLKEISNSSTWNLKYSKPEP